MTHPNYSAFINHSRGSWHVLAAVTRPKAGNTGTVDEFELLGSFETEAEAETFRAAYDEKVGA